MEKEEFLSRLEKLIPATSEKTNEKLLELGDAIWLEMKDDLYHAFTFVSHHFSRDVLQAVYDLSGAMEQDLLPWEIIGAGIYLQAGTPVEQISKSDWRDFTLFSIPQKNDTISSLATCTVRENGQETQFFTLHFGQFDPQELLDAAAVIAGKTEITVTEAIQQLDYNVKGPRSYVTANQALCGPGSTLAEKLLQLSPSYPITAAHITIDVDQEVTAVERNPLWEQLRDRLGETPPIQEAAHSNQKRASAHRNEPSR